MVKEQADAVHTAAFEVLRYSNELNSNYWRNYVMVIHFETSKIRHTKKQTPQQIDSAPNSYRLNMVKIERIPTAYS